MKEAGKGTNLLLPLGIGAGVLLLLVSMKKKKAEAAATDTTAALPAVSSEEASTPQILPSPAPSYAQAVAKTTQKEDTDDTDDTDEPEDAEQEAASDDTDDDEGESASSGSNAGYRPSSSINTNQATAPLPAYNTENRIVQNPVINNKAIRFQSDQARAALQKIRSNKATRFQPIPVKKPLVSTIARNINPLFIGKGKPRMGVQIPVTQAPGTTTALQQSIAISSQTAPTASAAIQTTIFPLRFGITSPYVKEVQRKIGVSSTGYFGTQTRAALQKRFRVTEISEALYKQIITGKAPVIAALKKPLAKIHPVRKAAVKKSKIIRRK